MKKLLFDIFNHDFTGGEVSQQFFARPLTLTDLQKVCAATCAGSIDIDGRAIPAAVKIKGGDGGTPFAILAQLHGNEPAGLAGILLAMALSQAGRLKRDIIGIIGNPVAAQQYFAALTATPHARQETRDAFRGGVNPDGSLMQDGNRIPVDFRERAADKPHIKRAQELYAIGEKISGILDIHSARGNMLCITDHKRDADLKNSPIRALLTELAEAISANASSNVTVQTLKTILHPLPNIECQLGIEAGRHESPDAPHNAASFTLSLLHTLGITDVPPVFKQENGIFERYAVQPRIVYGDLPHAPLRAGDQVYMARTCHALASVPQRSDTVIVKKDNGDHALQSIADFTKKPAGSMEYAVYQYDEMEAIAKDCVVAVAVPSGAAFKTAAGFSGIFLSKSAALYDKDPAVGPWPVPADKIASVKFCYPCAVSSFSIEF